MRKPMPFWLFLIAAFPRVLRLWWNGVTPRKFYRSYCEVVARNLSPAELKVEAQRSLARFDQLLAERDELRKRLKELRP